jgi:hypothetical protein
MTVYAAPRTITRPNRATGEGGVETPGVFYRTQRINYPGKTHHIRILSKSNSTIRKKTQEVIKKTSTIPN